MRVIFASPLILARIIRGEPRLRGEPSGAKAMDLYLGAACKLSFYSADVGKVRASCCAPTTRQGAKNAKFGKLFHSFPLRPLRLCGRFSEIRLRLCRAGLFVVKILVFRIHLSEAIPSIKIADRR